MDTQSSLLFHSRIEMPKPTQSTMPHNISATLFTPSHPVNSMLYIFYSVLETRTSDHHTFQVLHIILHSNWPDLTIWCIALAVHRPCINLAFHDKRHISRNLDRNQLPELCSLTAHISLLLWILPQLHRLAVAITYRTNSRIYQQILNTF